jgi:glycerol-1-phosphatase
MPDSTIPSSPSLSIAVRPRAGLASAPSSLSFSAVWDLYTRYAALLPPNPEPRQPPIRIANLDAIAARYDTLIFDAYGVLNRGAQAIDGARDAFERARRVTPHIIVLTNDASGDHAAIAAKHARRGFVISTDEIVAGVDLLPHRLSAANALHRFGYLGPQPRPYSKITAQMQDLSDPQVDLANICGFLLLEHPCWTPELQTALVETIAATPRPVLIGNPDITAPVADSFSVEPGYHALDLFLRTGHKPELLGKPNPQLYQHLLHTLGDPQPERILAIGDTLHTDILGARTVGMHTLLVESGVLRGQDALAHIAQSGIQPHYIAASIA